MKDIIRRIERIEAEFWAQLVGSLDAESRARLGAQVTRWDDATSLVTLSADVASLNRVVGLGVGSALDATRMQAINERYLEAGVPRWLVEWCPYGEPAHGGYVIQASGGSPRTPTVKFYADLGCMPVSEVRTNLRVVETDDRALFEKAVVGGMDGPPGCEPIFSSTVGLPGWRHYLVTQDSLPIGGGALFIQGDGAFLALGTTRAEYRNRGAQTALIAQRIADARSMGCRWVSTDTDPDIPQRPNPSFRNLKRAGMQVLYSRTKYLFERKTEVAIRTLEDFLTP